MSSLKVEVVRVDDILPHPNADRLEIAIIKGWNCVVPKGQFVPGGSAVYFPIDSILPEALETRLFPPDSKVKLHNHRIRTIRLRGAISQGLLVLPGDLALQPDVYVGEDLTDLLGVTKYEPPSRSPYSGCRQISKRKPNPNFNCYTDIENYKNYPMLFMAVDQVWVTEKIHGSNFRAGYVPTYADTLWKRIKQRLGMLPEYEFVYGSHLVQLQEPGSGWANNIREQLKRWLSHMPPMRAKHGFVSGPKNLYWEMVEKYDLKNKLGPGDVVYGEVYGDKVQKGCLYDCGIGERKLAVFDWQHGGKYLRHQSVINLCNLYGLQSVPVDYQGPFDSELIRKFVDSGSHLNMLIREGVVIKPIDEQTCYIGRRILKWKNDQFLLLMEDDTH